MDNIHFNIPSNKKEAYKHIIHGLEEGKYINDFIENRGELRFILDYEGYLHLSNPTKPLIINSFEFVKAGFKIKEVRTTCLKRFP